LTNTANCSKIEEGHESCRIQYNEKRVMKMARMETKVLTVAPNDVNGTIETVQRFGWTVIGTQEIYNKDSHLEKKNGELVSVTETTNFSKITLQRDRDMDYYDEICALENRYYALPIPKLNVGGKFLKFVAIISFIVAGISLIVGAEGSAGGWVLFFLFLGLGVLSIVFSTKKKNASKEVYKKELDAYNQQVAEIFHEVAAYV